jgi:ketosteroid isomerase-like protein
MPLNSIKPIIYLVALLGVTPAAWAGAAEEVAAIGQQTTAAFEKGDIDTFITAFADNAVFTPSVQAFRVEGRTAIKNYFSALFETYPTSYFVLTVTDKSGNVSVHNLRGSATWLKMDNQWRIVDQHNSEVNGADRS